MTTIKTRPTSKDDLAQIRDAACVALNDRRNLYNAMLVPTGTLLHVFHEHAERVSDVLQACGYATTIVRRSYVLVSGITDEAELLEGEIARLTERREALLADRQEA